MGSAAPAGRQVPARGDCGARMGAWARRKTNLASQGARLAGLRIRPGGSTLRAAATLQSSGVLVALVLSCPALLRSALL